MFLMYLKLSHAVNSVFLLWADMQVLMQKVCLEDAEGSHLNSEAEGLEVDWVFLFLCAELFICLQEALLLLELTYLSMLY